MSGALVVAAGISGGGGALSISPNPVTGQSSGSLVTSDLATISTATGPFAWSQVNGDAMSIQSPTQRSTRFFAEVMEFEPKSATFQCSTPAGVATVQVYLERV